MEYLQRCGMLTGDAYSRYLDQSFSRTCRYFSGLCTSNISQYFLNYASKNISYKCRYLLKLDKYGNITSFATSARWDAADGLLFVDSKHLIKCILL